MLNDRKNASTLFTATRSVAHEIPWQGDMDVLYTTQ